MRTSVVLFGVLSTAPALAAEPTVEELLRATDDVGRGESSVGVMQMDVKTDRYERSMKMQVWSKGTENSLIRILEPAKDAGVSTLKVGENMWNYLPKVDRTMKIPAGMMSGSWMGSHFSNDDLVKESRLDTDFTYTMDARPADNPERVYVITLVPKPDAPVVWGKVVLRIRADKVPVDTKFYDESGELARTMTYEDPKDFGKGLMPSRMTLIPADKPEEYTRITFTTIDFATPVPDATFSLQSLKQP
jgi:outer membrane lipoprotein-sorting protein